ncbi:uncharacterized protein LOC101217829 isoform X2 [Cucumis sativus]|uniref:DUF1350 domain-containing protein n=1 Tax=Cucumis sativus TaxID=3659 RepID=A0A0A0L5H3_CUCSA|nr:uncharacterized protein LOC101217829 isoform X2 [Cucumis sativus]KGN55396.1 hypothetical protein Csa_012537 [Cucumis sativus]
METSVTSAAGATLLPSSTAVVCRRRRWILLSNKTNRREYTLKRGIEDSSPLFNKFSKRTATSVSGTSSAFMKTMISNGYGGRNSNVNKIYKQLESCLVIPPPRGRPPRAIIKFLGGAFIGAIPEVTYSYLIEFLAKEGFLIISVPYNVTFDHADAARQVFERFHVCLDTVLASGLPDEDISPAQLVNLPLFSVGHSNGALLQVLTGSYFSEKIPKANAIISFNNRPATEAVPYFEQLGPLTSQMMPVVQASPVYSMARSASDNARKILLDAAGAIVPDSDREVLNSLTKFVDQLPSVFDQVTEGVSEFRPTPSENRDCFKCNYNIQNTLLVKFISDTIDETDLLEQTLKPRVEAINGTLEKVELSGNHITPCVQEPKWEVGYFYTPADAVAQALKSLSLRETRELAKTLTNWFERFQA